MPIGGGFLSAFMNKLFFPVLLEGDPLITHNVGGAPACAGFAFDGTYFYLNDMIGREIHVYTAAGVFVRTLNPPEFTYDLDYDPIFDELLGVSPNLTGIYRFSKTDGSLLGTYGAAESALLDHQFTSIAVDRSNDRIYLEFSDGMFIYALKMSTFGWGRIIYVPYEIVPAPHMSITSTMMIALDAEDRKKIWVGYKSFPPMFSRVDEDDKIDAFRVLGTCHEGVKSSIGVRFVNNRWYCWVGAGDGLGKLYALSGMPPILNPIVYPALPPAPEFDQDTYRWYEDDDRENPTPKALENSEITSVAVDDVLRLRLGILELTSSSLPWGQGIGIQFAEDPAGPWLDVASKGAIDKAWRFSDGKGEDKARIANLLLSNATVKEFFMESDPSPVSLEYRGPDRGEYDICVQAYLPQSYQDYYFRAKCAQELIKHYTRVPKASMGSIVWEFFQDFESEAVGSVPEGWIEEQGSFRVADDQASVGSHSLRLTGPSFCKGRRYLRTQPQEIRVQWDWRLAGGVGDDTRAICYIMGPGDNYYFLIFTWKNVESAFYYNDKAMGAVIPNAPPAIPNNWYHFDVRGNTATRKWNVIINGNDSGEMTGEYGIRPYIDNIRFSNNVATVWVDEVDVTVGLP